MIRKRRRLYAVIAGLVMLGAAAALILNASSSALRFFYQPAELAKAPHDRAFRLGGLVEAGSLLREADGATVHFRHRPDRHSQREPREPRSQGSLGRDRTGRASTRSHEPREGTSRSR